MRFSQNSCSSLWAYSHQAKAENDQRASEKDQGINGKHQQKIFAFARSEHSLTVLSEVQWSVGTVIENLKVFQGQGELSQVYQYLTVKKTTHMEGSFV